MISDGYRVRNEELGPEGIPFVRGGDIREGWIDTSTVDHIRPEFADRVRVKLARPGDVAFITKGTVGRAGRLQLGQPTVVFAPQVAYWRVLDTEVLDPGFIFYLVQSHQFQSALNGVKTHGAMAADYVSISLQHDFSFRFPDIDTQRSIARVLSSLDDKIELNRRMNRTLESMARAIFKSWFVDFDPVGRKMESGEVGLPPDLAALFPHTFQDTELGPIPAGWDSGSLADVAILNPEAWSRATRPAVISYLDLSNAKWGHIETRCQYSTDEAPSRAQRVLRPGDTVVGTVRPGNGSYALIAEEGLTGSTRFAVLRPRFREYREMVYFAATSRDSIAALSSLADGGAYPAVRPDVVASTPMALPPRQVARAFAGFAAPMLARVALGERESDRLAQLRDALLPKLLSGEFSPSAAA